MNIRIVQCDHLIDPITPQNINVAGGRGRGRGTELGRRTFIDNLVDRTNSSTRDCYQETPIRRILANPGVPASSSTVEEEEDIVSIA